MSENNQPQLCFDVGLNCEDCTTSSARELARACQGLRGKMVAQLFVQIYPASACSRMLPAFVAAYKAVSSEPEPLEMIPAIDLPLRKGVQTETEPRRAAAAAA